VRADSIKLWTALNALRICDISGCDGKCNTHSRLWIYGPPGVGKSTEVYGFAMYMATRNDVINRKNVLWVHEISNGNVKIVKVLNGVIWTGDILITGDEFRIEIMELSKDCNLICLDAIRVEMLTLISLFCQRKDALLVCCTSYQSSIASSELEVYIAPHFQMNHLMYSWTIDEYRLAASKELFVFPNITSEEDLFDQYFVAGGCMRFMHLPLQFSISSIRSMIETIADKELILNGLGGVKSSVAVNTLIAVYPQMNQFSIVSDYARIELSKSVDEKFLKHAKKMNTKNGLWQGWVFELYFLYWIRKSCKLTPLLLQGKNVESLSFMDQRGVADHDKNNKDNHNLESGTWYVPVNWNQGCFDAVYYHSVISAAESKEETKQDWTIHCFDFFNATVASKHDFKCQYIVDFINYYLPLPKNREKSIYNVNVTLNVVTTTNNVDRYNNNDLSNDDVLKVQIYDKNFSKTPKVFHIEF
jgi:hypothetical protein